MPEGQKSPAIPQIAGNSIWDYYQPNTQQQGVSGQVGGYDDPYNLYISAAPIMQRNATREIQSGLAGTGLSGNRYSSSAQRVGAQVGANTAMDMNSLLTNTLYNQYNQDADRAMGAASGLLGASGMVEDALGKRYGAYSGALKDRQQAWEAQRRAAMAASQAQYRDFEANKYGTLPMLLGSLSNSIGQGPEPILSTKPSQPGYGGMLMDWATLAQGW